MSTSFVSDKPSTSGGLVIVSDSSQAGGSDSIPSFPGGGTASSVDHAYAIASVHPISIATSSVSGIPQTATVVSGGSTPQGQAFATSVDLVAPVPPPPHFHVGLSGTVSQPFVSPAIVASGGMTGLTQPTSTPSLGGVGMGYIGFPPNSWPSWGAPGPSGSAFLQTGQGFNPFAAMAQGFNPFMPWAWMGQPPASQAGSTFQPPAVSVSVGEVRSGRVPSSSTPASFTAGSGFAVSASFPAVSVTDVSPSIPRGDGAGRSRVRAQQVRHRSLDADALSILADDESLDSDSDCGLPGVVPVRETVSHRAPSRVDDSDCASVASSAFVSHADGSSTFPSNQDLLKILEEFNPGAVTSVSAKVSESSSAKAALGLGPSGSTRMVLRASPAFVSARNSVANLARGGNEDAKNPVVVQPPLSGSVPDLPNGLPMGKFVIHKPSIRLSSLVALPSGEFAATPPGPSAEDLRLFHKQPTQGVPPGRVPFKALTGFESLARSGLLFQSATDHFVTGLISALKGGSVDPQAPLLVQDGVDTEAVHTFLHTIASCIESSSAVLARLQLGLLQARMDALLEHSSLCSSDRTSLRSLPPNEASLFGPSFVSALIKERAQNRRDEPAAPTSSASGSHHKAQKRPASKPAATSKPKQFKPDVSSAPKPKSPFFQRKGKGKAGRGKPFSPQ
jgi:hypothetical protein